MQRARRPVPEEQPAPIRPHAARSAGPLAPEPDHNLPNEPILDANPNKIHLLRRPKRTHLPPDPEPLRNAPTHASAPARRPYIIRLTSKESVSHAVSP